MGKQCSLRGANKKEKRKAEKTVLLEKKKFHWAGVQKFPVGKVKNRKFVLGQTKVKITEGGSKRILGRGGEARVNKGAAY